MTSKMTYLVAPLILILSATSFYFALAQETPAQEPPSPVSVEPEAAISPQGLDAVLEGCTAKVSWSLFGGTTIDVNCPLLSPTAREFVRRLPVDPLERAERLSQFNWANIDEGHKDWFFTVAGPLLREWEESGHNALFSYNRGYPLGHLPEASDTWPQPSDQQPEGHRRRISASWPANHGFEISRTWPMRHIEHNKLISPTWPPNTPPLVIASWILKDHDFAESKQTGVIENHAARVSARETQSHLERLSSTNQVLEAPVSEISITPVRTPSCNLVEDSRTPSGQQKGAGDKLVTLGFRCKFSLKFLGLGAGDFAKQAIANSLRADPALAAKVIEKIFAQQISDSGQWGACCMVDTTCQDLTEEECRAYRGTFVSDTICAEEPCSRLTAETTTTEQPMTQKIRLRITTVYEDGASAGAQNLSVTIFDATGRSIMQQTTETSPDGQVTLNFQLLPGEYKAVVQHPETKTQIEKKISVRAFESRPSERPSGELPSKLPKTVAKSWPQVIFTTIRNFLFPEPEIPYIFAQCYCEIKKEIRDEEGRISATLTRTFLVNKGESGPGGTDLSCKRIIGATSCEEAAGDCAMACQDMVWDFNTFGDYRVDGYPTYRSVPFDPRIRPSSYRPDDLRERIRFSLGENQCVQCSNDRQPAPNAMNRIEGLNAMWSLGPETDPPYVITAPGPISEENMRELEGIQVVAPTQIPPPPAIVPPSPPSL